MTSNNKIVVPEAKAAMNKFKMEAANEVGVNLKQRQQWIVSRLRWRPSWA